MWDFRNLIRRGGGRWPRSWRDRNRPPVRPPGPKPETSEPRSEDRGWRSEGGAKSAEESWLKPPWQPPRDSEDGWKKSG